MKQDDLDLLMSRLSINGSSFRSMCRRAGMHPVRATSLMRGTAKCARYEEYVELAKAAEACTDYPYIAATFQAPPDSSN
jgi:hypothetical protein